MGPGKHLLHIADRFEANTVLCSFNTIQPSSLWLHAFGQLSSQNCRRLSPIIELVWMSAMHLLSIPMVVVELHASVGWLWSVVPDCDSDNFWAKLGKSF